MKTLTLPQPLAALVAMGAKRLEAHPWPTYYLGPLAVHAASRLTPNGREHALWGPVHKLLAGAGLADPEALPLGAVVGIVQVTESRRIRLQDLVALPAWERQLGNYRAGRWMFRFGEAHLAPEPILAEGRSGLWEWRPPAGSPTWWEPFLG